MTTTVEQNLGQQLMLSFEGLEATAEILTWLAERPLGGFTLFRAKNVRDPAQIRNLTAALQSAATRGNGLPLLIAADQEGGQLVALGEATTHFAGNMALGATRDPELSRQVGRAIGRELSAMGVNVSYSPVCDVNTNPQNPNVGVRAFGDNPDLVAGMGAAMIEGLQATGVAATAKHFPGNGDSALDPHYGVPVLTHDHERLEEVEFRPFRAAVEAGVRLIMSAHVALPSLTGRADLPATLARRIMHGLMRETMSYDGLLITDALDMKAITQGAGQIVDVIAALRAGIDLLLLTSDVEGHERIYAGVQLALSRALISEEQVWASARRIMALKQWLSVQGQLSLDVVGCEEHRRLEEEVARRCLTLVRSQENLLPLQLPADSSIVVIMPRPADLTPADSSSYVRPALAEALRVYHPRVDEIIVEQQPTDDEIAAIRQQATDYDLLILGTTSAHLQEHQAVLVRELLELNTPTITVALRTPYDLLSYPKSTTHICTYSLQPAVMSALAAALFGQIAFQGRLPVRIPGLYDYGHQLRL